MGKIEQERHKRIYKGGKYYHPTKKGIVMAISPYGLSYDKININKNGLEPLKTPK